MMADLMILCARRARSSRRTARTRRMSIPRSAKPRLEVVVVTYRSCLSAERELGQEMVSLARWRPDVDWHFVDKSGDRPSSHVIVARPTPNVSCGPTTRVSPQHPIRSAELPRRLAFPPQPRCPVWDNPRAHLADAVRGTRDRRGQYGDQWTAPRGRLPEPQRVELIDSPCGSGLEVIRARAAARASIRGPSSSSREASPSHCSHGGSADLASHSHRHGYKCRVLDLGLPHQGGHSVASGAESTRFKVRSLYRNPFDRCTPQHLRRRLFGVHHDVRACPRGVGAEEPATRVRLAPACRASLTGCGRRCRFGGCDDHARHSYRHLQGDGAGRAMCTERRPRSRAEPRTRHPHVRAGQRRAR